MSAPARRPSRFVSPFSAYPVNTFVNGTAELVTLCAIKLLPQLFSRPKPRRMINTRELALRACFPQQSKQPSWVTRWFGAPSRSSKAGTRNHVAAKMVSGALALDKGLQQLFSIFPGADAAGPCLKQLTPDAIAQWAQAHGASVRWNGPGSLESALAQTSTVIGPSGILDLLQQALNECHSTAKLNGTRLRVDTDGLFLCTIERSSAGKVVDVDYSHILDAYETLKELSKVGGQVLDIGEPFAQKLLDRLMQQEDGLYINWGTRDDLDRLSGRRFTAWGSGYPCSLSDFFGTAPEPEPEPAAKKDGTDNKPFLIGFGAGMGLMFVAAVGVLCVFKHREIGACLKKAGAAPCTRPQSVVNNAAQQVQPRQHVSVFNPGPAQIDVEDDAAEMQREPGGSRSKESDRSSSFNAESDSEEKSV